MDTQKTNIELNLELEAKIISEKYNEIIKCSGITEPSKLKNIKKAFDFAYKAHEGMRRKSGEPYIMHPLQVALIVTKNIGLKTTSIICAFLHDVVEDTDYTVKDIELMFGETVAKIVDGLTKISGVFSQSGSLQAENFRKVLLTLADDVRVILIKLADRLHNMRTLESMSYDKQMKISSETSMLYAPLAHRLGLFTIKTELEDLVLKHKDPEAYRMISGKLEAGQVDRKKYIAKFIIPIEEKIKETKIKYKILYREKSISSIWHKMKTKQVDFEHVYDLYAVRIIVDSDLNTEKQDCWNIYSIVTGIYTPKQDRFRNWLSFPKANGYEALHTTVMSQSGKWVEVQIRSTRMDEIAEKGYAAHWKYKEVTKTEGGLDEWLTKIRELLQDSNSDALDFFDDFKLNLFSDEIYIFTPSGEIKTMPKKSSVIDFAYAIHTEIGEQAIGAKINSQLVPLNHTLRSGDQVEILTSKSQTPKEEWLKWATTSIAKSRIEKKLRIEEKQIAEKGSEKLKIYFKNLDIEFNDSAIKKLMNFLVINNETELFIRVEKNLIKEEDILTFVKFNKNKKGKWSNIFSVFNRKSKNENTENDLVNISEEIRIKLKNKPNDLLLSKKYDKSDVDIAKCCKPINGDEVIGFVKDNGKIDIHRTTCQVASDLMAKYGDKIIKVKWREHGELQFLTGIKIYGNDQIGMIKDIVNVISSEFGINIRSFSITTDSGLFEADITLYVIDVKQLNSIIMKLQKVSGIQKTYRID